MQPLGNCQLRQMGVCLVQVTKPLLTHWVKTGNLSHMMSFVQWWTLCLSLSRHKAQAEQVGLLVPDGKTFVLVTGFDGGGVLVKVSISIFGMGGQVMVIFSILVMVWGMVKAAVGVGFLSHTWCK